MYNLYKAQAISVKTILKIESLYPPSINWFTALAITRDVAIH